MAFDAILREPGLADGHDEARYQLARTLSLAGLDHSALGYFDEILERGPSRTRYFHSALEWLFKVSGTTASEQEVLPRVARHARDGAPPEYQDRFHFLLAKYEFERGRALDEAGKTEEARTSWREASRLAGLVRREAGATHRPGGGGRGRRRRLRPRPVRRRAGPLRARRRAVGQREVQGGGPAHQPEEGAGRRRRAARAGLPAAGPAPLPEPAEPLRHLLLRQDAVGRDAVAGGAVGGLLRPLPHRRAREGAGQPAHAAVGLLQGRVLPRVLGAEGHRLLRELPLPRGAAGCWRPSTPRTSRSTTSWWR